MSANPVVRSDAACSSAGHVRLRNNVDSFSCRQETLHTAVAESCLPCAGDALYQQGPALHDSPLALLGRKLAPASALKDKLPGPRRSHRLATQQVSFFGGLLPEQMAANCTGGQAIGYALVYSVSKSRNRTSCNSTLLLYRGW